MRVSTLGLVLVALIASLAEAQTQPKRTAITGAFTYELGAARETVVQNDAGLALGSRIVWSSRVPTITYSKRIEAPIGGNNYTANLGLQFYQDRLGAILVEWPVSAFRNVDTWRHASSALHNQLINTYDGGIIEHNYPAGRYDSNTMFTLKDASGNRLRLIASDFRITVVYVWSTFDSAIGQSATPRGNY